MNKTKSLLSVALFIIICPIGEQVHAQTTAIKANDFLNSIGVCTHMSQNIDNPAKVSTALNYIGIRNIRDDGATTLPKLQRFIDVYNATGSKTCLLSVNGDIAASIFEYETLAAAGALLAVEGPNEPNNWPVTYKSQTSSNTTSLPIAEFQKDLYAAVKANPKLAGIPVFHSSESGGSQPNNCGLQFLTIPVGSGTLMPDGTQYADYANTHNYIMGTWQNPKLIDNQAWGAADPILNSRWDGMYGNYHHTWWSPGFNGYTLTQLPSVPKVATETGWPTQGTDAISEDEQGKLFLNLYLSAYKQNWSYTFIYMLRDDPNQGYWGLVRPDYSYKPSAVYLHNMTTILADALSAFTSGTVNYSIPNMPTTVHEMLMQKSDGTFELAVWNERVSGNNKVMVNLGNIYATVKVYDPTIGTSAQQIFINVDSVLLTLSDHPMIIEFKEVATNIETNLDQKENRIYPNPFKINFNVNISSNTILKEAIFKIYDLSGKEVRSILLNSNETMIKRGELQDGIYYYSIINNGVTTDQGKLVIQ